MAVPYTFQLSTSPIPLSELDANFTYFTTAITVTGTNISVAGTTTTANAIVNANSSTAALRVTQVGTGNALLVEDSANPDATPFVVTSAGDVLVGTDTKVTSYVTAPVQIAGTTGTAASFAQYAWNAGASSTPYFLMNKSRGAAVGTRGVVSSGDSLGFIDFCGDDGTSFIRAAEIVGAVDGTPGTNDMPGRLIFSTTADGASTPTERMRIASTGAVGIGTSSFTTSKLRVLENQSDAASTYNIILGDGTHTLTADNAVSFNGIGGLANLNQNGFNATVSLASGGNAKGSSNRAYVTGASGTVTSAVGSYSDVRNTGAGILTNAVGFQAAFINSGGGTLTNTYGVYIGASTAGTNNYGFYSAIASGTGRYNLYMVGTADNYIAGRLGIGSTSLTTVSLRLGTDISGGTTAYGFYNNPTVQPAVTAAAVYNQAISSTASNGGVPYTVSNLKLNSASQGTFNADSIVTNQYGYTVEANLIGATNNYGFFSAIPAGTGRYNLYMSGTADNYLAGSLGIGSTALSDRSLSISKSITGATFAYGVVNNGAIQSDVTTSVQMYRSGPSIAAAAFTLASLNHFYATTTSIGAGATVSNQYGFLAESTLTGATNNYGFYGNIAAGTGRWNFYAAGAADNYFAGNVAIGTTTTSIAKLYVSAGNIATDQSVLSRVSSALANGSRGFRGLIDGTEYFALYNDNTNTVLSASGTTRINVINSTGTISLGAAPGSESLRVTPVASAVNYWNAGGAATGAIPYLQANGSDTNIGLIYTTKGSGAHYFQTNNFGSIQFLINHTASAVNYIQVAGGATGNAATLSTQGSDTNIDLALTPKGTGNVKFGTLTANADAPITGYITIRDSGGTLRKLAVIA